jgi:hypothetical protein
MSWQLRLLDLYLRRVERPKLARAVDIAPFARAMLSLTADNMLLSDRIVVAIWK